MSSSRPVVVRKLGDSDCDLVELKSDMTFEQFRSLLNSISTAAMCFQFSSKGKTYSVRLSPTSFANFKALETLELEYTEERSAVFFASPKASTASDMRLPAQLVAFTASLVAGDKSFRLYALTPAAFPQQVTLVNMQFALADWCRSLTAPMRSLVESNDPALAVVPLDEGGPLPWQKEKLVTEQSSAPATSMGSPLAARVAMAHAVGAKGIVFYSTNGKPAKQLLQSIGQNLLMYPLDTSLVFPVAFISDDISPLFEPGRENHMVVKGASCVMDGVRIVGNLTLEPPSFLPTNTKTTTLSEATSSSAEDAKKSQTPKPDANKAARAETASDALSAAKAAYKSAVSAQVQDEESSGEPQAKKSKPGRPRAYDTKEKMDHLTQELTDLQFRAVDVTYDNARPAIIHATCNLCDSRLTFHGGVRQRALRHHVTCMNKRVKVSLRKSAPSSLSVPTEVVSAAAVKAFLESGPVSTEEDNDPSSDSGDSGDASDTNDSSDSSDAGPRVTSK
eukprot:m.181682 g.181682  ORF g.181682 m.181682 type:complete len:506 (-) comp16632_c2_seq3:165-1682(-)